MTAPDLATPRTDVMAFDQRCCGGEYTVHIDMTPRGDYVDADFARKLERENAALVAALVACYLMLGDFVVSGRATEQTRVVARKVVAALALARQS